MSDLDTLVSRLGARFGDLTLVDALINIIGHFSLLHIERHPCQTRAPSIRLPRIGGQSIVAYMYWRSVGAQDGRAIEVGDDSRDGARYFRSLRAALIRS